MGCNEICNKIKLLAFWQRNQNEAGRVENISFAYEEYKSTYTTNCAVQLQDYLLSYMSHALLIELTDISMLKKWANIDFIQSTSSFHFNSHNKRAYLSSKGII